MKKADVELKEKASAATTAAKTKSAVKPKSVAKSRAAAPTPKPAEKSKARPGSAAEKGKKAAPAAKEKIRKPRLIRDSFTMPEEEYAVLGDVKKLCLKAGIEVKKSELLRIGVAHIRQLSLPELKKSIASLMPLKAGRPKKEK